MPCLVGVLGDVQHGGGIDHLAAHLGGGGIYHREPGGEGVSGVDHAAVHRSLSDLGGHFLDVGTVGNQSFLRQFCFGKAVVFKDLLSVLPHGHVLVAHGHKYVPGLEPLGQLVKGLDSGGIALGHGQGDLVFQNVGAGALEHKVQPVGIDVGGGGTVQLIHLLLPGGDEDVAVGAGRNLGF